MSGVRTQRNEIENSRTWISVIRERAYTHIWEARGLTPIKYPDGINFLPRPRRWFWIVPRVEHIHSILNLIIENLHEICKLKVENVKVSKFWTFNALFRHADKLFWSYYSDFDNILVLQAAILDPQIWILNLYFRFVISDVQNPRILSFILIEWLLKFDPPYLIYHFKLFKICYS